MDNAITRECKCVIASDEDIRTAVSDVSGDIISLYKDCDPDMVISAVLIEKRSCSMSENSTLNVIGFLNELPYGVIAMSKEIIGLVETSLNPGVLKTAGNTVSLCFSVRSGKDAEKEKLCNLLREICKKYNCNISFRSPYPAWEYKKESALRDTMAEVYRQMHGKELEITAIHAGLECGIFSGKIQNLDCVPLGPDMFDIHTPNERLSISSCERVWNYLLRVLETI